MRLRGPLSERVDAMGAGNRIFEGRVKDSPLVSIGIPTFNRVVSLRRAIESVLAQDYANLELVISDNASCDQTDSLCQSFCSRDTRVRYIRQPSNQGAFTNFVTVLREAAGDYFMWLGDDDWLEQSYVSRCLEILRSHTDVSLACGVAMYYDDDKWDFQGVKVDLPQASPSDRVLTYYRRVNDNGTFYGLMNREMVLRNHTQNVLGGDWLLIARIAFLGKIVTLDDVAVCRSSKGTSADVRSLALKLGLSARKARQPHRTIAMNVARDIVRRSPAFANLGIVSRWVLAWKCARIVHRRFVVTENPLQLLSKRIVARGKRALRLT